MIVLFQLQIYTNFESNSQQIIDAVREAQVVSAANIYKFRKQFTTWYDAVHTPPLLFQLQIYTNFESNSQQAPLLEKWCVGCFSCKYIQISKAIHNRSCISLSCCRLFQLQIYTNFESNSQHLSLYLRLQPSCFSCKYIQISKAIHNTTSNARTYPLVVSAANIYKFRKQFTTDDDIVTDSSRCFSCKYIQISKAIHNQDLIYH